MNSDDLNLRSEQVRKIIGSPPNYIIRNGTIIICLIITTILILAQLINLPVYKNCYILKSNNYDYQFSIGIDNVNDILLVKEKSIIKFRDGLNPLFGIVEELSNEIMFNGEYYIVPVNLILEERPDINKLDVQLDVTSSVSAKIFAGNKSALKVILNM